MHGPEQPTSGARRAALALHALAPQEQAEILRRLQPAERETLQRLNVELDTLGIPRRLATEMLTRARTGLQPPPQAPHARLAAVLRAQSAPTIAQVLSVQLPGVASACRAELPAELSHHADLALESPAGLPAAYRAALIACVAARLSSAATVQGPPHPAPGARSRPQATGRLGDLLRGALRRWTR